MAKDNSWMLGIFVLVLFYWGWTNGYFQSVAASPNDNNQPPDDNTPLGNDTNADYCSGQIAPYTNWAEWWIAEEHCNFYQCPHTADGKPQWCSASRNTLSSNGFACSCQPIKAGTGGVPIPNQAQCGTAFSGLYGLSNMAAAQAFYNAYDCHESQGNCVASMTGPHSLWEGSCQ